MKYLKYFFKRYRSLRIGRLVMLFMKTIRAMFIMRVMFVHQLMLLLTVLRMLFVPQMKMYCSYYVANCDTFNTYDNKYYKRPELKRSEFVDEIFIKLFLANQKFCTNALQNKKAFYFMIELICTRNQNRQIPTENLFFINQYIGS